MSGKKTLIEPLLIKEILSKKYGTVFRLIRTLCSVACITKENSVSKKRFKARSYKASKISKLYFFWYTHTI